MATLEQLERALVNADAAGDAAGARTLAAAVKAARFEQKVAAQRAADRKLYDPTAGMSTLGKLTAGFGESMDRVGNLFRSDAEVADREKLNTALMDTGAGKTGQVLGDIAKGLVAGGGATAAVRAAPAVFGGARAALTSVPKLSTAMLGEALGGAGLSAAEAAPKDRGEQALIGAVLSAGGEALGRGASRVIAPFRSGARTTAGEILGPKVAGTKLDLPLQPSGTQMGSTGERALQQSDMSAIVNSLGRDVETALPLSAKLPGEAAQGPMRMEIALRNLPVVGKGMKHEDKLIRDAYTRALFREAGTDVGEEVVGPQAFRRMDTTLNTRQDALKAAVGPFRHSMLADKLLETSQNYRPTAAERAGGDALASTAAKLRSTATDAAAQSRRAADTRNIAEIGYRNEGVGGLAMDIDDARQATVNARLAAGPNWQEDEAYKAARGEWDTLRRLSSEVRSTEQGLTAAERASVAANTQAQRAADRASGATSKAFDRAQQTGWGDFDALVADAARAKTPDDLLDLTRRSNDMFGDIRVGQDPGKTAKLDALRGFKTSIFDTLDDALPADQKGGFKKLAQQWGVASTLREARDTAGQGAFDPKAVSNALESVFGPKSAAAEKLPLQELTGALERRASGSFAAGPEQYKALMAGTLMGEGVVGMAQKGAAYLTAPGTMFLLGTPLGRKLMQAGVSREMAARMVQESISGAATGQADVPGLF